MKNAGAGGNVGGTFGFGEMSSTYSYSTVHTHMKEEGHQNGRRSKVKNTAWT